MDDLIIKDVVLYIVLSHALYSVSLLTSPNFELFIINAKKNT